MNSSFSIHYFIRLLSPEPYCSCRRFAVQEDERAFELPLRSVAGRLSVRFSGLPAVASTSLIKKPAASFEKKRSRGAVGTPELTMQRAASGEVTRHRRAGLHSDDSGVRSRVRTRAAKQQCSQWAGYGPSASCCQVCQNTGKQLLRQISITWSRLIHSSHRRLITFRILFL